MESRNKLGPIQKMKQDIEDLRLAFAGEIVRNPCGHLWRKGFICICDVDHSEEAYKAKRSRQH